MKKKFLAAALSTAMVLSLGVSAVPVMAEDDGEPYRLPSC